MTDHITKDRRSWNMSRIRSRHTKPELIIRSLLHRAGYRFRLNYRKLPGKPDIVLPKYKAAIFVHGCFWHRHENCSRATTPNTNREYWLKKFEKNVKRDKERRKEIRDLGWKVIVVWECEVMKDPISVLDSVIMSLDDNNSLEYFPELDRRQIIKAAEKKSEYYLENE
jgi:DNA mismatch endonuclease (patch repair protein)